MCCYLEGKREGREKAWSEQPLSVYTTSRLSESCNDTFYLNYDRAPVTQFPHGLQDWALKSWGCAEQRTDLLTKEA